MEAMKYHLLYDRRHTLQNERLDQLDLKVTLRKYVLLQGLVTYPILCSIAEGLKHRAYS